MPGSADQGMAGIAELVGNFPNPSDKGFIKWGMFYLPDFLDPGRATSLGGDFWKLMCNSLQARSANESSQERRSTVNWTWPGMMFLELGVL